MLVIRNLNLIITKNCNFNCAHCLRGESSNEDIGMRLVGKYLKRKQ